MREIMARTSQEIRHSRSDERHIWSCQLLRKSLCTHMRVTLYCCVMRLSLVKSVRHDVMLQSFVKSIRHDVMLQSLVKSVHHDVMLQSFVKTLRGLSFAVDARCDRGGTRSGLAHHSVAYMLGRHQGQSSRCRRRHRRRRPDRSVVASYYGACRLSVLQSSYVCTFTHMYTS